MRCSSPPVLPATVEGPAVEEVAILRDEGANLAWAIERSVPTASGRPQRLLPPPVPLRPPAATATRLRYVPMSRVADNWFPLALVQQMPGPRRLARADVVIESPDEPRTPRGQIIRGAFVVLDDEVPTEGVMLRRRWELALAGDGRPYLWCAREKQPAAGEIASGLTFDRLVEE